MTETTKFELKFGPIIWPLFLIAFTLKLTGHVEWSWFAVLAPLWVPFALLMIGVLAGSFTAALVAGIAIVRDGRKESSK